MNIWDNDPFGIRSVTLGGDVPGLQTEIDFLNRKRKVADDERKQDNE